MSQHKPRQPKTAPSKDTPARQGSRSPSQAPKPASTPKSAAATPQRPAAPVPLPKQPTVRDVISPDLGTKDPERRGTITKHERAQAHLADQARHNVLRLLDEKGELQRQLEEARNPERLHKLQEQLTQLEEMVKEAQTNHKALEQELKNLKAAQSERDAHFILTMRVMAQIALVAGRQLSYYLVRPDVPVLMAGFTSSKASYQVAPTDCALTVQSVDLAEQDVPINGYGLTWLAFLVVMAAEEVTLQELQQTPDRIPAHLRSQLNRRSNGSPDRHELGPGTGDPDDSSGS